MAGDEKKVDAVFEGGGVKGIALIGAAAIVEAAGYAFQNLAGTSAGAIIATLLAAGYSATELRPILMGLDFKQFEDTSLLGKIPLLGQEYEIVRYLGIYDGDYFLNLIRRLLSEKLKKDKVTFRDLILPGNTEDRYRFKVHVIASDISRGRMLVLPDDIRAYGMEPEDLEVATAVRMSMSIPFFFKPVTEKNRKGDTCYIVDGGLLSNFPIELFDTPPPADPEWPTFGFARATEVNAVPGRRRRAPDPRPGHDALGDVQHGDGGPRRLLHVAPRRVARTIKIDNLGISATAFDLSDAQKQQLYESGQAGAREFLKTWNFEQYKSQFRGGQLDVRRQPAMLRPAATPLEGRSGRPELTRAVGPLLMAWPQEGWCQTLFLVLTCRLPKRKTKSPVYRYLPVDRFIRLISTARPGKGFLRWSTYTWGQTDLEVSCEAEGEFQRHGLGWVD